MKHILWPPCIAGCGHIYIFVLFLLSILFPRRSQRSQIGCLPYFYTWRGLLSANLECRSEMCCTWLAENTEPKKSPSGHHRTNLSRYIFATKAHIDNREKSVKQQCLPDLSSQYCELQPTSGWDLLASLGHPCKFQQVSRLGSVSARHSSSGRQTNCAALNRGRHLYSAGRPSRWALAHISSSEGNVARCGSETSMMTVLLYYKFTDESDGKRILKIYRHLAKVRTRYTRWPWLAHPLAFIGINTENVRCQQRY